MINISINCDYKLKYNNCNFIYFDDSVYYLPAHEALRVNISDHLDPRRKRMCIIDKIEQQKI